MSEPVGPRAALNPTMRKLLMLSAALGMLGAGLGCSRSLDRARANYHENRADRAASHGRYEKAAREERKADVARDDAHRDVLP